MLSQYSIMYARVLGKCAHAIVSVSYVSDIYQNTELE